MPPKIVQASTEELRAGARELLAEYLAWGTDGLQREYGVTMDIAAMLEHDLQTLGEFAPPGGRLLVVEDTAGSDPVEQVAAGGRSGGAAPVVACIGLRGIAPGIGEIMRMYVKPAYRRQGIGHALVTAILQEARAIGYDHLRLDSPRFMTDAHALYRAFGFKDIAPYAGSEIPEEIRRYWIFMELGL
jgi:GNAT superfamily N-acetyltransferase